ncbi:SpoIIE family protein phosphatase [Streptomyces sp. M10(2022)]
MRLRGPDGRSHLLEFSGHDGHRLTGPCCVSPTARPRSWISPVASCSGSTRGDLPGHRPLSRPGSVLALFTDGLIERAGTDIDEGIERLRGSIAEVGGSRLADAADRVIGDARQAPDRPDDIALLQAARWSDVRQVHRPGDPPPDDGLGHRQTRRCPLHA